MQKDNNKDDFDFNLDDDIDLENPFADDTHQKAEKADSSKKDEPPFSEFSPPTPIREEHKKRTSKDFNPDMDALLLTAQSPMIIEGMKSYTKGNFSSSTLPTYMEALKGVSLYIKILDRNPNNYIKLKQLIDADQDCKEVETIAFNLYKKIYHENPKSEDEKLTAFEKFESLFVEAVNKANISNSIRRLKKYLLLSGNVDEIKVKEYYKSNFQEFTDDIQNFSEHLKIASDFLKKGKGGLSAGSKGRELNIFIIKASFVLYMYHSMNGDEQNSQYYNRIHNNYKKYFIVRD